MDYDLERWPFIARVRRDSQYSSRIKRPFIKEELRTYKQFEKGQGQKRCEHDTLAQSRAKSHHRWSFI